MLVQPFNCLHPRKIFNKSLGRFITVGCGSCKACLMKRANNMSLQCSIEEQDYRYCMFVTLTFKNEYVPLMRPEETFLADGSIGYRFYDVTERLSEENQIFGDYLFQDNFLSGYKLRQIISKTRNKTLDGIDIPYLRKRDLQLFLKRFRKLLTQYSDEKIRYYAVGEYGPVHFRPHFHLLFYFNDEQIFKNFRKLLLLSWSLRSRCYDKRRKKFYYKTRSLGRVDFSLSRGKCSSYVANYVNSRVSMPRLFTFDAVRPFNSHSKYFAQSFYKNQKKEIYENEPVYFVEQCRQISSNFTIVRPWRSLISVFFPKVVGYGQMSVSELHYAYTVFAKAKHIYKTACVSELSNRIVNSIIYQQIRPYQYDYLRNLYCLPTLLRFFAKYADVDCIKLKDILNDDDQTNKLLHRVQHILYVSKHFITFCCDNNANLYRSRVDTIIKFYDYLDYKNLTSMYDNMNELIDYNTMNILPFIYDNFDSSETPIFLMSGIPLVDDFLSSYDGNLDIQTLKSFQDFCYQTEVYFSKSIKHKYQNDANQIYIY